MNETLSLAVRKLRRERGRQSSRQVGSVAEYQRSRKEDTDRYDGPEVEVFLRGLSIGDSRLEGEARTVMVMLSNPSMRCVVALKTLVPIAYHASAEHRKAEDRSRRILDGKRCYTDELGSSATSEAAHIKMG